MQEYIFCVYSQKPQRVDMYISTLFSQFSRSYVQKLIDEGQVKVNGQTMKKNAKVYHQDHLHIELKRTDVNLKAENIPLDVIYEDEDICVVNKDSGINVHPTPGIDGNTGTIVNALLYHLGDKLPCISGENRPGIIHRLDKDTSGVLITVKNDSIMHDLSQKIKNREVEKYYIAIVVGRVQDKNITINSQIGRHKTDRTKMTIQDSINPKNATSHGELLGYIDDKYSVLRIKIETGRTHQIRVHFASIGHPILGDKVYGSERENQYANLHYSLERQALHAYMYGLMLYGKEQSFVAPLKNDMQKMISHHIALAKNLEF